jgi:hypothetical protein
VKPTEDNTTLDSGNDEEKSASSDEEKWLRVIIIINVVFNNHIENTFYSTDQMFICFDGQMIQVELV